MSATTQARWGTFGGRRLASLAARPATVLYPTDPAPGVELREDIDEELTDAPAGFPHTQ